MLANIVRYIKLESTAADREWVKLTYSFVLSKPVILTSVLGMAAY